MIAILAASALLAYSFPLDEARSFDVKVVFDGYIPLLGGQQGKVEVNLGVEAKGQKPDDKGDLQVNSELKAISVVFNGAPLNFVTIESAKDYFPLTLISISKFGETLKTNAPDLQLPIKLPGLDIKRFPDITYLPLELPKEGAEMGKSYSFKKIFGESNVLYKVTPRAITDDAVDMDLTLEQKYSVLENESVEVVKNEKDAVSVVETDLKGKGKAKFDRKLGCFSLVNVSADANSVVTDLKTKKTSQRKLKTSLDITLKQKG